MIGERKKWLNDKKKGKSRILSKNWSEEKQRDSASISVLIHWLIFCLWFCDCKRAIMLGCLYLDTSRHICIYWDQVDLKDDNSIFRYICGNIDNKLLGYILKTTLFYLYEHTHTYTHTGIYTHTQIHTHTQWDRLVMGNN